MIIPKNRLATFYLRYFAFTKIPLIFFVRPSVVYLDDKTTIIKIPFRRKVKNHWGSMYFGALSIGADLAAGFLAFQKIIEQNQQISLIFKNFTADFFKRAEDDTLFLCNEGNKIGDLINKAVKSGERVEEVVEVRATVPTKFADEPVAQFKLTLSLKRQ